MVTLFEEGEMTWCFKIICVYLLHSFVVWSNLFVTFFCDFLKCLLCSAHFVWMAKASTSAVRSSCLDLCTRSITVVGSTCLRLFATLWWDSSGLKVGHLVCNEHAACPQWSFKREMSLFVFWTSVWKGGISPSCSSRHLLSLFWSKKQLSCLWRWVLSLGFGRACSLVCRQKYAFVSQCWASSSFHCWMSVWSVFPRTPALARSLSK